MAKLTTPRRQKIRPVPILLIEDNADQWLIIRSVLAQSFPEVEPIWKNTVEHAIQYLQTYATDEDKMPRLILCDLYMPRREDGLRMLQFINTHSFCRKPPVVIMSSSQDDEDITKVYNFNVASYIVKPETYNKWLNSFYIFRRYWWEIVKLPIRPQ